MEQNTTSVKVLAVVALLVALAALAMVGMRNDVFGAVTPTTTLAATVRADGGIRVGSSGTTVSKVIVATCDLLANNSISATSTGAADCAVTGVVAGDRIVGVVLATTTVVTNLGVQVVGANASSTAGFVTFKLANWTGAAVVPSAISKFGSSTQVFIERRSDATTL